MVEAVWLLHHGFPFGAAFGMTEAEVQAFTMDSVMRTAFSILCSEFTSGREFNWTRWAFDEPK